VGVDIIAAERRLASLGIADSSPLFAQKNGAAAMAAPFSFVFAARA
jgi:hypothetical protein